MMELEAFLKLANGDKVVYNGTNVWDNQMYGIEGGAVLTRLDNWMDDDASSCFSYDRNGISCYHWFRNDQVQLPKE